MEVDGLMVFCVQCAHGYMYDYLGREQNVECVCVLVCFGAFHVLANPTYGIVDFMPWLFILYMYMLGFPCLCVCFAGKASYWEVKLECILSLTK